VTQLGVGLAALGRPAYLNLGRTDALPAHRTVAKMRAASWAVLDAAYDAGIRWVDVARSYGLAEEFLAGWLERRDHPDVTVSSKWGCERCSVSQCPSVSLSYDLRMRLSDWARIQGVHYQTAWKWAREGTMPVPVVKTATGRYLVLAETPAAGAGIALYARVSSADQKPDLDRQVARLTQWATGNGLLVARAVSEVGSALNGARPKLKRLLADSDVAVIVVEHRDRLARFGVEYIEAALSAQGRSVRVVEDGEMEDDLVRDMTDVLTSFCARLYGRRAARNRARKALAAAREDCA
jgi:putative resolvase